VVHLQVHTTSIRNRGRSFNIEHDHLIIFEIFYSFIIEIFIFKFKSTFKFNLRSRSQNTIMIINIIPIKICDCVI